MKKLKKFLKVFLSAFLALAIVMLSLLVSAVIAGTSYTEKNIEYQNNHLEYLKNEYYAEGYVPCDEQTLTAFDLEKAYAYYKDVYSTDVTFADLNTRMLDVAAKLKAANA